jgi:hypothetical protein
MQTACWPSKSGWQKQQYSTVWETVEECKEERGYLALPQKLFFVFTIVWEIRGWGQLKINGSLNRSESADNQMLIVTILS